MRNDDYVAGEKRGHRIALALIRTKLEWRLREVNRDSMGHTRDYLVGERAALEYGIAKCNKLLREVA